MRRPLGDYHTLRPGYERQRRQEYEKWLLHVARLKTSSRQLMYSLKEHLMLRKRKAEQLQHLESLPLRNP